ncbi:HGxxPAAW family protein [Knoellia sp. S7-12]|uniref:HGxxPAAW family protein n=1 Tax=Knoellia sp. S7-12 TaxID=3126698 RepID=UPI003367802F
MAEHDDDDNHGNSVAAWVMVGLVLLGSFIMSLAFIFPSVALFVVGVVVVIAGLVAGKLMALAGYGINGDVARSDTNLS